MHKFPCDPSLRAEWIRLIARKDFSSHLTRRAIISSPVRFLNEEQEASCDHNFFRVFFTPFPTRVS